MLFRSVQDALGFIAGITLALIVSIAVLIGIFKLFFELLKTYVTIIISIATAPMTLMIGAVPGQNNFGKWLKSLIGNLMAFPTVLLALILFKLFTREGGGLESGGFVPPFLIGGGQGQAVLTLVGIGVILVMPELVKEVKKAMGASGGLWDQLSGAAWKNAQAGEIAIPGALGLGASIGGAGRAAVEVLRPGSGYSPRQAMNAIFRTGVTIDPGDGGPARVVGGAARVGGKWWERGQSIRRTVDRAQEGRLFEAEDIEKTLSRLAGKREEEKDSSESTRIGPEPDL